MKAYFMTGEKDWHPVINFLMRGRPLSCSHGDDDIVFQVHKHRYVPPVPLHQVTSWSHSPLLILPWEQMIPPGCSATFNFSKYGFSKRHLAGPACENTAICLQGCKISAVVNYIAHILLCPPLSFLAPSFLFLSFPAYPPFLLFPLSLPTLLTPFSPFLIVLTNTNTKMY